MLSGMDGVCPGKIVYWGGGSVGANCGPTMGWLTQPLPLDRLRCPGFVATMCVCVWGDLF